MAEFQHIITRSDGPDDHMIGLGDLVVQEMGGGVGLRTGETLQWRGSSDYAAPQEQSAPRELHLLDLDGTQMLLASGQYGNRIDAWQIHGNGTPGMARPLTLSGPDADANRGGITLMEQIEIGRQHVFVTANRYADGLEVWLRDGSTLRQSGQTETSGFLAAGLVQAMALATPGGLPFIVAASSDGDDLLAFRLAPGGVLGQLVRLDLRDGLFIDMPTQNVTAQVNDTIETRFDNLAVLEVLETPEGFLCWQAAPTTG